MSLYYADDSEDSFEDFLEWRRWKRSQRKVGREGGEAHVEAAPARKALPPSSAAPVASASSSKQAVATVPKGKEEASAPVARAAATGAPAPAAAAAAPVAVAAVPAATNAAAPKEVVAVPRSADATEAVAAVPVKTAGEAWVVEFNKANDKGKKDLRKAISNETAAVLAAGKYTAADGVVVTLDVEGAATGKTVFTGEEKHDNFPSGFSTTAHFVKADAIETALFLIEKKSVNPLVVIPADPKNLGNGFPGSGSLEEQLFRRSTAQAAFGPDANYNIPEKGAIYLPNIQVFRDSETKNGYQFLKAPRKVAFLLASSVANPKFELKGGRNYVLDAEAKTLLEAKITTILSAGLAKGHDAIVITAFGSGFNKTPPQAVAAIFRDLLTTTFSNTYKHVTFAIIEDENCNKEHNPAGNLTPFQQEFLAVQSKGKGKCC